MLPKSLELCGLEEGKTTKISKRVKNVAEESGVMWFRGAKSNTNG